MSFADLGLNNALQSTLARLNYSEPTPIQAQAIPVVLEGKDLLAAAQTGTGKTAAFTLPILQYLSQSPGERKRMPRALVLTPTRELAAQVNDSLRGYAGKIPLRSAVIYGGVSAVPQIKTLRQGVDVVVATPGRLLDHVNQRNIDLSRIEVLILDEADRMLDMGFIHDIRKVIAKLPRQRQNLMFSATFSKDIRKLAKGLLYDPVEIDVAPRNSTADLVKQKIVHVAKHQKRDFLSWLIGSNDWQQVLVFTRTKHGANRLCDQLTEDGLPAAALHGNKSQGARTKALQGFKEGKVRVLVATDIAARGLDIDQLPHVINFELPMVAADYVHRIGRTGRAGISGEALSLVSREERSLLKDIHKLLGREVPTLEVEGFHLQEEKAGMPAKKPGHGGGGRSRNNKSQRSGGGRSGQSAKKGGNGKRSSSRRGKPGGSSRNASGGQQGHHKQGQRTGQRKSGANHSPGNKSRNRQRSVA